MLPKDEVTEVHFEVDETEEESAYVSYDIATYPSDFTLQGIVDMWHQGDITIPEFQRDYVWSRRQASLLIESFLLGLPVPPVFFYVDSSNKNLVIDGQQRILTTVFFFDEHFGPESTHSRPRAFRLTGLSDKSPYARKRMSDLTESVQRKLRNTVLRAINIRQLSPEGDNTSIYHIFERLNTGGTPLRPQEIRNVVFRGPIIEELRLLNRNPYWRRIVGTQTPSKHQTDVELILRLLALGEAGQQYEKPMKEFLNKAMNRHRQAASPYVHWFREAFEEACRAVVTILGDKPFHIRGPFNSAAMDSVMLATMAHRGQVSEGFRERYHSLQLDSEFTELTTTGTTDTAAVRQRLRMAEKWLFG